MAAQTLTEPQAYRYFFALLPDAITARRIHAFAGRTLGEGRLMAFERLHMTLALAPDSVEPQPALVDAMVRAGERVASAPFELTLDELSINSRTVALRLSHRLKPLAALHRAIDEAMAAQGIALHADYSFSPHVTLRYHGGELVHRPIHGFSWRAQEFVLIESLVGLGHYEVLGRWPLQAPPERQGNLFAD